MMQKLVHKARLTYQAATNRGCHTLLTLLALLYYHMYVVPLTTGIRGTEASSSRQPSPPPSSTNHSSL
jgi:hypothetical protein